jgi:microsomal dipeptidase-like Zn-dependent dipeptidase
MELRREEARTEFIRRGYSTSEIEQIEAGDWFRVISDHKRRVWLRAVG